jgi:biopolymer transport protein ExbD
MKRRFVKDHSPIGLNMTPIIDIVFLLIIFFMIVCQFITEQNFEVSVPDDVTSAEEFAQQDDNGGTTVTVMLDEQGVVSYAVDADVIPVGNGNVSELIARAIDTRLKATDEQRTVSLRIDKDIEFKDSQYALAGISNSNASGMKLAAHKDKRN